MEASRAHEWRQLVEYSRSMLDRAEAGEWEQLADMARERQARFERFFRQPVTAELADEVAEGIHRIADIDSAITSLGKEAGKSFAAEQGVLQQRKRASAAYADTSNSGR